MHSLKFCALPELLSTVYAFSISMDLLMGLRSVGFVTGADILASCIAGGLVIGGDVAVGVVRLVRIADGVCWLLLWC